MADLAIGIGAGPSVIKAVALTLAGGQAAAAIGASPDMDACISECVAPLPGPAEAPVPALVAAHDGLFPAHLAARHGLAPAWAALARRPLPGDVP